MIFFRRMRRKPRRRSYATARTNDHISDTPRDQRVCRCWFKRPPNCDGSRLLSLDGTQVEATITQARTRWLQFPDGASCRWSQQYLSSRMKGDHPPVTHTPPRLGSNDPSHCPQDGCGIRIMRVDGVGKVSLITIVGVVSRLKAESYPSLESTNPALPDYQLTDAPEPSSRMGSLRC